jgi:carbamate kinase
MLPKVQAACEFVAGASGRTAIIGSLERAAAALAGASGTHIVP